MTEETNDLDSYNAALYKQPEPVEETNITPEAQQPHEKMMGEQEESRTSEHQKPGYVKRTIVDLDSERKRARLVRDFYVKEAREQFGVDALEKRVEAIEDYLHQLHGHRLTPEPNTKGPETDGNEENKA